MSFDFKLVNGTISLGKTGDIEPVIGINKLSQDIIKILATATGTNLMHRWYGSSIPGSLVGSGLKKSILANEIVKSVGLSIQNLKSLQEQQERAGQVLLPEECIKSVEGIQVMPTTDPRSVSILITIKTRSGKIIQEELALTL